MDLPCTRRVDPVHQSPWTRMYGYFTHGTVPPSRPYSSGFLSLPNCLRRLPSPAHFRRQFPGHAAFTALVVLHSRPSTDWASLATSLSLIGPLTPVPPGDPASPPEVTHCSSVPCRPQAPWCGGRMSKALPSLLPPPPFSPLCRPAPPCGSPPRFGPLLLPPPSPLHPPPRPPPPP